MFTWGWVGWGDPGLTDGSHLETRLSPVGGVGCAVPAGGLVPDGMAPGDGAPDPLDGPELKTAPSSEKGQVREPGERIQSCCPAKGFHGLLTTWEPSGPPKSRTRSRVRPGVKVEAAGVTCGAAWRPHPRSARRWAERRNPHDQTPRLAPAIGLRFANPGGFASRRLTSIGCIEKGLTTGMAVRPSSHGGGGSRTRVHEWSIKSLYVRRSLRRFDFGGQ